MDEAGGDPLLCIPHTLSDTTAPEAPRTTAPFVKPREQPVEHLEQSNAQGALSTHRRNRYHKKNLCNKDLAELSGELSPFLLLRHTHELFRMLLFKKYIEREVRRYERIEINWSRKPEPFLEERQEEPKPAGNGSSGPGQKQFLLLDRTRRAMKSFVHWNHLNRKLELLKPFQARIATEPSRAEAGSPWNSQIKHVHFHSQSSEFVTRLHVNTQTAESGNT